MGGEHLKWEIESTETYEYDCEGISDALQIHRLHFAGVDTHGRSRVNTLPHPQCRSRRRSFLMMSDIIEWPSQADGYLTEFGYQPGTQR